MDNMEYIDDYFSGDRSESQTQSFEKRIIEEPAFAMDVAFYVSAKNAIAQQMQEDKKQRFQEIYQQHKKVVPIKKYRQPFEWRYMAAACTIAVVMLLAWFVFRGKTTPANLADQYIQENWKTMSVTMSAKQDSMQAALALYNTGNFNQSLESFESILKNDSTNVSAKKYAGIVSLRSLQYDKALQYFTSLANTTLYSNEGKLYMAVTLMKRSRPEDIEAAKKLLVDIRDNDLEGKEQAVKWLKKIE
ncbi:hypothetical protein BH11BAC3_BH11BAC3_32980 [soil metagenome]